MNGVFVGMWASVGLVAGAIAAPTASWLAGTVHRSCYRMMIVGITSMAFSLIALRCSTSSELLAHSVFVAVAVLLALVDILVQQLPRSLIWPTCLAMTGMLAIEAIRSGDVTDILRAISAAIALTGAYLAIAIASRGGLGAGDVRLAVLVGGVLGWHSWSAVIDGVVLGFISTGVVAVLYAAGRRMPAALPHGPGMLAGAFVALLL